MLSKIVACLFLIWSGNALSSISMLRNGTVVLSGHLSIEDYQKFLNISKQQKVTHVKFHKCLSGNGLAAFRFAEKIRASKINTIASSVVASACSLAFLGGTTRITDEEYAENTIQFHGMFYPDSLLPKGREANQEVLNIWKQHIGFTFSKTTAEIILNTTEIDEGIFFIKRTKENVTSYVTLYCDGKSKLSMTACKPVTTTNLIMENILTESILKDPPKK